MEYIYWKNEDLVATKTLQEGEREFCNNVRHVIRRNFPDQYQPEDALSFDNINFALGLYDHLASPQSARSLCGSLYFHLFHSENDFSSFSGSYIAFWKKIIEDEELFLSMVKQEMKYLMRFNARFFKGSVSDLALHPQVESVIALGGKNFGITAVHIGCKKMGAGYVVFRLLDKGDM